MTIISHRGYWKNPSEKNSSEAFRRSFELGFGTETDARDLKGSLVIPHDMPSGHEMSLQSLLELFNDSRLPLALNIKADGLAQALLETMRSANVKDWFVFDMSVPDSRSYFKAGIPVFVRMSEVEKVPAWVEKASGIWLDAFEADWYDSAFVEHLLGKGLRVCIVSPELHGRQPNATWEKLLPLAKHEKLLLCTDFPEEARKYFRSKNG